MVTFGHKSEGEWMLHLHPIAGPSSCLIASATQANRAASVSSSGRSRGPPRRRSAGATTCGGGQYIARQQRQARQQQPANTAKLTEKR